MNITLNATEIVPRAYEQVKTVYVEYMSVSGTVVLLVNTIVASVVLHELGHVLYAYLRLKSEHPRYLAKIGLVDGKLKMWALNDQIMQQLDAYDRILMSIAGITVGFIPIGLAICVNLWALLLVPLYYLGCKADIELIKANYALWKGTKHVEKTKKRN